MRTCDTARRGSPGPSRDTPQPTMTFARQSLGSLAALVFGVSVSILLPRVLGAEARGEYQLAVKLAGLVLAIAQWGIPEVLLQAVAERRGQRGVLIGTS